MKVKVKVKYMLHENENKAVIETQCKQQGQLLFGNCIRLRTSSE